MLISKRNLFILIYIYCCTSCVPTTDLFSESINDRSTERFYIKFSEDFYKREGIAVPLYELSSDELIGLKDCGVNKDEESFEDTYCILDLNEADIGVLGQADRGIAIEYNIPRQMCEYTSFMAPWHWNQRSGFGPLEVDECTLTPPPGTENASEQKYIRVSGGNWKLQEEGQKENCDYDQSENGRANCCFGKSLANIYVGTGNSSTACALDTEAEQTEKDWGGDIKECIGGPVRSGDWEAFVDIEGIGEVPIATIFYSWTMDEPRQIYEIGPVEQGVVIPFSTPTATYFDGIEDLNFTNFNTCSNCPGMFYPDDNRIIENNINQLRLPIGYPYFTLECLDSNHESLHRVHLIIREWNTKEEFLSFKNSDGRSGDPDLEGTEGGDCQYYESDEKIGFQGNFANCNDYLDLDDWTKASNIINSTSIYSIDPPYPQASYEGGGSSPQ